MLKVNERILDIDPYVGGDYIPEGMFRRIGLSSNENSWGPSPKVFPAIQEELSQIYHYPSGGCATLKSAIANRYNLDPKCIVCGNGSEQLLHFVASVHAEPRDEILFFQYAFLVYKIAAMRFGATPVVVPSLNRELDLDLMLSYVSQRTKIIFLDNPANPLGKYIPFSEIKRFHQNLREDILLVLDGAYAEYAADLNDYDSGLEYAKNHENIIVTRSFSKIYGLAGLRVGWAFGPRNSIDAINAIRQPFNVNILGQRAATVAIGDEQWIQSIRQNTQDNMRWTCEHLEKLDLHAKINPTNFLLIDCTNYKYSAEEIYKYLGYNGILIRRLHGYGLPDCFRITIGQRSEMIELVRSLEKMIKGE